LSSSAVLSFPRERAIARIIHEDHSIFMNNAG